MLAATLTFSLVNLCVKLLNEPSFLFPETRTYPVHELVFFRSVISLSICLVVVRMKKLPLFGNNHLWLITRGLFGSTGLFLFFMTIQHLPLAIATTVQYLSPVFTVVVAIYLLNEKVKWLQWIFFIISMSGIFVLGYDSSENADVSFWWILVGVISAFFSGVAYNAIMKCRDTEAPITVVMYFPLVAVPITGIWCIAGDFIIPQGNEWFLILAMGVLTQVAQVCMTRAFLAESASVVAPLKYVGAVYASFLGYFIFDERLNGWAVGGIVLIVAGVLLNTWYKKVFLRVDTSSHSELQK